MKQSYGTIYKKTTQVGTLKTLDKGDDDEIKTNEVFETGRMDDMAYHDNDVINISDADDESGTRGNTSATDDSHEEGDDDDSVENRNVKLNTLVRSAHNILETISIAKLKIKKINKWLLKKYLHLYTWVDGIY